LTCSRTSGTVCRNTAHGFPFRDMFEYWGGNPTRSKEPPLLQCTLLQTPPLAPAHLRTFFTECDRSRPWIHRNTSRRRARSGGARITSSGACIVSKEQGRPEGVSLLVVRAMRDALPPLVGPPDRSEARGRLVWGSSRLKKEVGACVVGLRRSGACRRSPAKIKPHR